MAVSSTLRGLPWIMAVDYVLFVNSCSIIDREFCDMQNTNYFQFIFYSPWLISGQVLHRLRCFKPATDFPVNKKVLLLCSFVFVLRVRSNVNKRIKIVFFKVTLQPLGHQSNHTNRIIKSVCSSSLSSEHEPL